MEIKGKNNTAVAYLKELEPKAYDQVAELCNQEFAKDAKIRIMPDAHTGAGCVIGLTMNVTDKAVPNMVGVDIGCGMMTTKLGKIDLDFRGLDEACHRIPSGTAVQKKILYDFPLDKLRCYEALDRVERLNKSLGSLGAGNHFIECDMAEDGTKYLVIHSGSRNLGVQVANYYQHKAIMAINGKNPKEEELKATIKALRKQGQSPELEAAYNALQAEQQKKAIPDALCYVSGQDFEDYLHDIDLCQQFAVKNRELMTAALLDKLGIEGLESFHTVHNYIDVKNMILRKGAVSAQKDEMLLVPINMRDGSILAIGKGNADWNFSAPHGAGRLMSRSAAKEKLSIQEYKECMKGIYTSSVGIGTLDEAPMAYKPIEDILGVLQETAEVVEVLKPVYNFKAS